MAKAGHWGNLRRPICPDGESCPRCVSQKTCCECGCARNKSGASLCYGKYGRGDDSKCIVTAFFCPNAGGNGGTAAECKERK